MSAKPKQVKSFRPSQKARDMLSKTAKKTGKTESWLIERSILFALSQKRAIQ